MNEKEQPKCHDCGAQQKILKACYRPGSPCKSVALCDACYAKDPNRMEDK